MAKLTDQLSTDMSGKPVRDPGYIDGGLGTALSTVSKGFDVFMDMKAQSDAARKAKKKEEFDSEGRNAEFEAFQAIGRAEELSRPIAVTPLPDDSTPEERAAEGAPLSSSVFGNQMAGDVPDDVASMAAASGERIKSVEAAVAQATMPGISLNAAMNKEFQKVINKFPEHTTKVIEIWKKMGIDNALFRSIRQEQADYDAVKARELKMEDTAYEAGIEFVGEQAHLYQPSEIMALGLRQIRLNGELEIAEAHSRIASTNATLSEAERKREQEDADYEVERASQVAIHNSFAPVTRAFQAGLTRIMKLPSGKQEQAFLELGALLEQQGTASVNQMVTERVAKGYRGDPEKLRATLTNAYSGTLKMFTSDVGLAQTRLNQLKLIETNLKINLHEAFPVFNALNELGLENPEIEAQLLSLPEEMKERLRTEIKGATFEFGRENASTRIMNVARMLSGQKSFDELTPQEKAQAIVTTAGKPFQNVLKAYNRGERTNPTAIINGLGATITAARDIGPINSGTVLFNATQGFASDDARQALISMATNPNSPGHAEAKAVAMGSRAASAMILESINSKLESGAGGNRYWRGVFDHDDGKWKAKFDQRKYDADLKLSAQGSQNGRFAGMNINQGGRLPPNKTMPKELWMLVGAGNENLENIIALKRFDPTTPAGTDLELRKYYGRNILPKSLQGPGKEQINPEKELDNILDTVRKSFDDLPLTTQEVSLPPAERWRRDAGNKPALSAVEKAANEFGIPQDVAIGLIGKESSFNPGAVGVPVASRGGDRAMGLGQLMAREGTAAAQALGLPADRSSWSVDQQARAAMWLLKQKFGETGTNDWKDAVSRYFSGSNMKGNKRSDANGTNVPSYIKDIFG